MAAVLRTHPAPLPPFLPGWLAVFRGVRGTGLGRDRSLMPWRNAQMAPTCSAPTHVAEAAERPDPSIPMRLRSVITTIVPCSVVLESPGAFS